MTKAKLIEIIDKYHSIFELENKTKIYIGYLNLFSENSIGKEFKIDLIPRHELLSMKQNLDGNFKFISSEDIIPDEKNKKYYMFKDKKNDKIIMITDSHNSNLNNLEYGYSYDLKLNKDYKVINWKYDVKENKDYNLDRVTLIKKITDNVFHAETENKEIINLRVQKRFYVPDYLIGKTILVEKYQKFLATSITVNNINRLNFDFKIKENPIFTGLSKDIPESKIIDISNNRFLLLCKNIMADINLNKKFNANLDRIYVTQNYTLNKDGPYKLEQVLNINNINLYFFSYQNNILVSLIVNNPRLTNFIGEKFNLNLNKLSLAENIEENKNGNFQFLSIIDNKYIFKDLKKNKKVVCLLRNSKTPSDSNVGKIFNLNLVDVLLGININNVN